MTSPLTPSTTPNTASASSSANYESGVSSSTGAATAASPSRAPSHCGECGKEFTVFRWRHQCDDCKRYFCSACSKYQGAEKKYFTCDPCWVMPGPSGNLGERRTAQEESLLNDAGPVNITLLPETNRRKSREASEGDDDKDDANKDGGRKRGGSTTTKKKKFQDEDHTPAALMTAPPMEIDTSRYKTSDKPDYSGVGAKKTDGQLHYRSMENGDDDDAPATKKIKDVLGAIGEGVSTGAANLKDAAVEGRDSIGAKMKAWLDKIRDGDHHRDHHEQHTSASATNEEARQEATSDFKPLKEEDL